MTRATARRLGTKASCYVALAMVVALAGTANAYAAGKGHKGRARHHGATGLTAVEVARAASGIATSSLSLSGTVASTASLPLSPGIAGRVSAVDVIPGQLVKGGQILLSLADPVLQAQLAEARAAVATAQAKLAAAGAGPTPQAVAVAQAEVAKAQVALQDAEQAPVSGTKSTAVTQPTGAKLSASQAQAAAAQAQAVVAAQAEAATQAHAQAVASAQAALNLAEAQAAQVQAAPAPAALAPLQDAVTQAKDAEAVVAAQVAQSSVTAPFAGVVTSVPAVVGEQASPGTTLLTLEGSALSIQAPVSQMEVSLIRQGEVASISVPGQQASLPGSVTAISPGADPTSLTFGVTVTPSSEPSWLHPGEAASVAVVTARVPGAVLVPASAVVSINGKPQVFTVGAGQKVALVDVTPGISDGSTTAVTGLSAGTEVVSLGQTYLAAGDRVRVTGTTAVPGTVNGSSVGGLLTAPVTPVAAAKATSGAGGGSPAAPTAGGGKGGGKGG